MRSLANHSFSFKIIICSLLAIPTHSRVFDPEKALLTRCSCESTDNKPKCNLRPLSKSMLIAVTDFLMEKHLVCRADADGIVLPSIAREEKRMQRESDRFADVSLDGAVRVAEKQHATTDISASSKLIPATASTTPAGHCIFDGSSCVMQDGFIQLLFPTLLFTTSLIRDQISLDHNAQLQELLLGLEADAKGCEFNLHGGYRSKDGFLQRQEPAVQWLKRMIVHSVEYVLAFSQNPAQANPRGSQSGIPFRVEGWGAVLRGGHGQNAHVHPGSMYAGVYYVTAPPEVGKGKRSNGCLFFIDPRGGASMAQVLRGKNLYGDSVEVCPGGSEGLGLLVLFPSWLMHEVKPMVESVSGPRIAISFNVIFDPVPMYFS